MLVSDSLVFGPCCVMQYFCKILAKEERAGCFSLIVFLMSCDCLCSESLPLSVIGWSAVCDCGISWSCLLLPVMICTFFRVTVPVFKSP